MALPAYVQEKRKQCLDDYKRIVNNAVKNYQQFQKIADSWQKSLGQNHKKSQLDYDIRYRYSSTIAVEHFI